MSPSIGVSITAGDRDTNDDDQGDDTGASSAALLRAGYQLYFSRASRLGVAATLRLDGRDAFVGVGLNGTWALADASYASW